MSAAESHNFLTVDQFLDEWAGAGRAELFDGIAYAMAGGTSRHNKVAVNAVGALIGSARQRNCELFINDMALKIDEWTAYLPDVMVVCDATDDATRTRSAPCLLIEVLSPSTHGTDEREKRQAYQRIASLHDYLTVDPDAMTATHHFRQPDNTWTWRALGQNELCDTRCLGPLALADLFIGL
jgi:Uma2 family endonuclease